MSGAVGDDLADRLKGRARELGFDFVGVAPAVAPPGYPRFLDWLDAGYGDGMTYLAKHREARGDPASVMAGVRSIVVAGFVYGEAVAEAGPLQGKVARYARGGDYHDLLWKRLERLLDWLKAERPGTLGRAAADTAPLLERDFARMAGLGWIGKNTMLIDRAHGSFTVLGALLVDCDLTADAPFERDHCGTCTRCLDACPTDAFAAPYVLDAGRCISYATIEHRGPLPDALAANLDGWVFGCDVCQDVCPWNRKAPPGTEPTLSARDEWTNPDLIAWLDRGADAWAITLRGSAQRRAKRSGLVRNAALVLGSRNAREAIPALTRLLDDPDPTIRWAADWALTRIS